MAVRSEISSLEMVLTHRPGLEHKYVSPSHIREMVVKNGKFIPNPNFILFDDITDHLKIGNEHDNLTKVLNAWTDGNCVEITALLSELFENVKIRKSVFCTIHLIDFISNHEAVFFGEKWLFCSLYEELTLMVI